MREHKYNKMSCKERYPIGTKVFITRDCRRFKRSFNKIGVIIKYINYIIPVDMFPLNIGTKKERIELSINDLEEDLKITMPIIKYGRFAKIRGDQCFWEEVKK